MCFCSDSYKIWHCFIYNIYIYFMLLRHGVYQRKNSACHILRFFLLCHYELNLSEETMEYMKHYCYCVCVCLPTYVECFPSHKMHLFNLRNVPKKSSCALRPEGQIVWRSSSAFPNYSVRVSTCSVLWSRKYSVRGYFVITLMLMTLFRKAVDTGLLSHNFT
jgi:hypothetical protein